MVFLYGRAQGKHGGKQHYTAQNRFFTPDAGSNGSHRDIGADGCNCGNQQAVGKAAALDSPVNLRIFGKSGSYRIVAHEPEGNGNQDEYQAPFYFRRHGGIGGLRFFHRTLCNIQITVDFLTFLTQWIFLYFPQKEQHCGNHYQRNDQENGEVIGLAGFRYQRGNQDQGNHAANRAHQVDDGIRLGAQRLGRNVGHQGNGRGTVAAHGNQRNA